MYFCTPIFLRYHRTITSTMRDHLAKKGVAMRYAQKIFTVFLLYTSDACSSRSIHRPQSLPIPTISAYWENSPAEKHTLRSASIDPHNIFELYDKEYLIKHWFNIEQETTKKQTLTNDLIEAIEKIKNSTHPLTSFDHFVILKDCDFDHKRHAGNIVLKHKILPYVAKIFIETPTSFVHPFSKGIEPCCFFFMGYGTTRYLCGLTRIKNREAIVKIIEGDDSLRNIFFIPRKWYWEPPHNNHFCVDGKSFPDNKVYHVTYPHVYVIICDLVNIDRPFSYFSRIDRSYINNITKVLKNNRIDPNAPNFVYEKNTSKIALIDTEHFATMMGLEKTIPFKQYRQWYTQLALGFVRNCIFQTKKDQRQHITKREVSENLRI